MQQIKEDCSDKDNQLISTVEAFHDRVGKITSPFIPFIPRFDLWFNVKSQSEQKEPLLEGVMGLDNFSNSLGFVPYTNVPDFMPQRKLENNIHRAIGFYDIIEALYSIKFNKVKVSSAKNTDNNSLTVKYHTPVGDAVTEIIYTPDMKKSGTSISWVKSHILKSIDDIKVMEYIFDDMEIVDRNFKYAEYINDKKPDYIPIAYGFIASSGMLHIMRDFLPVNDFYLWLNDYPQKLEKLAKVISKKLADAILILKKCPADIIFLGGNFDSTITYPAFYKKYILTDFYEFVEELHKAGKKVVSHTDGENKALWDLYLETKIDILEAVAVYPMVSESMKEIIEKMGNKVTLWGLVDSIALLENSMSLDNFHKYIEELIGFAKKYPVILGISDTSPTDMSIDRLLYIRDRLKKENKK